MRCFQHHTHSVPPMEKMHCNSLGELEDVKNELFHFNPIWFVWFDQLTLGVHMWDFLLGHVVLQPWLVLPDRQTKREEKKRDHLCTV